jgi:hypothetical protein
MNLLHLQEIRLVGVDQESIRAGPSKLQRSTGNNFMTENIWCRNPNLAKCGGEAQHLEKLGI